MNVPELLPCPFCGSNNLEIVEGKRVDKRKMDSAGRVRKRAEISHFVDCNYCGATSGDSFKCMDTDEEAVTAAMEMQSKKAAVLLWNARSPINENAFKLINDLITEAYKKL